jgi:hypothetical protein
MVGMELMMSLYALLYAFPHIPTTLLDEGDVLGQADEPGQSSDPSQEGKQWFSVMSTEAMRAALDALLQTSEVLDSALAPGQAITDLSRTVVADARRLSEFLDLRLYDDDVPATCRQMFETIAAMYNALDRVDITTRDELWTLYQRYQIISMDYQLPGLSRVETANRSALLRFCSELAVSWLQPYVSKNPAFYLPPDTVATACKAVR